MLIAPDIYVHYTYSRGYLADSDKLDQNITAFLNDFRVSGPAFHVIQ